MATYMVKGQFDRHRFRYTLLSYRKPLHSLSTHNGIQSRLHTANRRIEGAKMILVVRIPKCFKPLSHDVVLLLLKILLLLEQPVNTFFCILSQLFCQLRSTVANVFRITIHLTKYPLSPDTVMLLLWN